MSDSDSQREPAPAKVALGTHVEIELIDPSGESERLAFDVVPDDQADFRSGLSGEGTPLGRAILGRRVGEQMIYKAAEVLKVRIISIDPVASQPSDEAAARRKEAVQEAATQIERTNAMIFATTVEGKWGGYDADGMMKDWEDKASKES
jgi:hypothetical protein